MTPKLSVLTVVASVAMLCAACDLVGIDKLDERGTTALMRAAARGDTAEVTRLIARGADVNAEVPRRDLREMIALASGDRDLPMSDIGYTPLLYASKSRNPRVLGILIEDGADVNHATREGMTAFRIAFERSDVRIMQLLTAAGVRPTSEQLARAVERSPPEVVGLMLQRGADPNEYQHAGNKPPLVVTATKRGDPAILRLLIDAKANVNARDQNGLTPLRWARDAEIRHASPNAPQLIALLEGAGARDDGGVKAVALFDAVQKKDIARVRAALRSGANPNARDHNGIRPLNYAAANGAADIVAALIGAGAHLNVSPLAPYGPTPLNAAIENGHLAVVKELLKAGASSDQRDGRGLTPLVVASISKRADMTALLLADSAKAEPQAFHLAVRNADTRQVRMLLDHGADPNVYKGGALREAVRGCRDRDNTDVVRLLLDRGADPRAVKVEFVRFYVLHAAAQWCTPQAVSLLLARGADPNSLDDMRRTPLIVAAAAGKLENVRALIAAGADLKPQDKTGKTALQYAAAFPDVLQALREAAMRQSKGAEQ